MADTERDWRLNPVAGDVVRKRNIDYTVENDSRGCFCITKRRFGRHGVRTDGYSHANDWRRWVAKAVLIKRGDSE